MRQQYFLPVMLPDNRVIGVVPIAPTTYTGDETMAFVAARGYTIRRVTYKPIPRSNALAEMDFMAIDMDFTEYRSSWGDGRLSRLLDPLVTDARWLMGNVVQFKRELQGDLDYWLSGQDKGAMAAVIIPSAPTGNAVSATWQANAPFSNAPKCQFIEVPWQTLGAITSPENIVSVAIGTASADPGAGHSLKAMVVQPTNIAGATGVYTSIRVLRLDPAGEVPTGTYTWPLTITDKFNQTTTINVSVVVA